MEDHGNEQSDRTRQLMADSGMSWNKAWRQAETELGPIHGDSSVASRELSRRRTWAWVAVGFATAVLPIISAMLILWLIDPQGDDATRRGLYAAFVALLGIPALVTVGAGIWFGRLGEWALGWRTSVRLLSGIVSGFTAFVIVGAVTLGDESAGLAIAVLPIGIFMFGLPLFGTGLALGSILMLIRKAEPQ